MSKKLLELSKKIKSEHISNVNSKSVMKIYHETHLANIGLPWDNKYLV